MRSLWHCLRNLHWAVACSVQLQIISLTNTSQSPILSLLISKGHDEEEYTLPLAREGGCRLRICAGRLPEGKDVEGSFRAGTPKEFSRIPVGVPGLSPLQDSAFDL